MNQRATPDKAYVPAPVEHIANVITHGISILPSAYGSIVLLSRSTNWVQFTAAAVYGISLVLCFAVSTAFHCFFYTGKNRFLKEILHRGDRAMIYVFIAASYFPWLLLRPLPAHSLVSTHLWWIVWALAFFEQMFDAIGRNSNHQRRADLLRRDFLLQVRWHPAMRPRHLAPLRHLRRQHSFLRYPRPLILKRNYISDVTTQMTSLHDIHIFLRSLYY
ncbi:hypothetical protein GE061_004899 [Apolygus lucorum]|uniref:Monocyte to macrophage differentiation factor 2 n=1 Tax=Apolygus lucorum TaxID=248454 RepID=A0A6A4IU11_APOLU|nr:hypothetical protein GE061_004899 [Apolygus lucorum]